MFVDVKSMYSCYVCMRLLDNVVGQSRVILMMVRSELAILKHMYYLSIHIQLKRHATRLHPYRCILMNVNRGMQCARGGGTSRRETDLKFGPHTNAMLKFPYDQY